MRAAPTVILLASVSTIRGNVVSIQAFLASLSISFLKHFLQAILQLVKSLLFLSSPVEDIYEPIHEVGLGSDAMVKTSEHHETSQESSDFRDVSRSRLVYQGINSCRTYLMFSPEMR
jgi:hypothetical protein